MKLRILILAACVLVSSCVNDPRAARRIPQSAAFDYQTVLAGSIVEPDFQAGWSKTIGPKILVDDWGKPKRYWLEGWTDARRTRMDDTFRLMIAAGFPKRVFLKQAYAEGREWPTKAIDRERRDCGYGCAVVETVAVEFSADEINAHIRNGLMLKVVGRRADVSVMVPGSYFAGVLEAHRRYRIVAMRPDG